MRWTERQLAMLREMGVRVWPRDDKDAAAGDETADVALADAEPSRSFRGDESTQAIASATSLPARERGDADRLLPPTDGSSDPSTASRAARSNRADPSAAPGTAAVVALCPADWLVVAEAPAVGADETSLGAIGRTGSSGTAEPADEERLLVAMLRAVRVSFDAPTQAGRAARVVVDPGLRDRLAGVLETVQPRVVLALGRAAAEALVGIDEPLGRLRGRVHALGDAVVIVTFAPSYLLRHPTEKAKAWADLCLAVRAGDASGAAG